MINFHFTEIRIDAIECPKCHQPLRPLEVSCVPVICNPVALGLLW